MNARHPVPPDWTLDAFIDTIDRGKVGLWSWNPERRTATLDSLSQAFWGGLHDQVQPLDALFERIDPRDRDEAVARWWASRFSDETLHVRFPDAAGRRTGALGVGSRGRQRR